MGITIDKILGDALLHEHEAGDIPDLTTVLDNRYVLKAGDTMEGNLNMNSNCLLGGTAVDSILKLQGTSGNGTATSPAIQLLVGNNGATVGATIINNGSIGFGTAAPAAPFHIHRTGSIDELFRLTSYGSTIPSITFGTGNDAPGVGIINLWRAASGVITVMLTGSLTTDTYFNGSNVAIGATSAGGYKLNVTGTLIASDYYSGDGTQGATATATGLVFKDGLYTSGTVDFTGLVTTSQATPQTIGDTSNRLLKLWATDITVTNAITGSVTGNAGTVTNGVYTTGAGTVYEVPLTFGNGLTRTANAVANNLITGLAGGQTVIGGTASGNNLTLQSTSNATKGKILFGTSGYDEVNNRLGIGTASPAYTFEISESDVSGYKTIFKLGATNGGEFSVLNNSALNTVFLPSFNMKSIGVNGRAGNFIGYIPVLNDVQNSTFGVVTFSARLKDETAPLNALTFAFQNYTTTVMCIDPNGDLGIGSTAPDERLHVVGNAYVTGRMGLGTAVSASADLRINSTATHESSLYAGIWQSVSYNPVGTPVAGTNVRGLLFQVSTPATADNLSNVILYGALGQVTHGGSGALGQAIGMNPGVFLTGSGAVTTSAGITLSATASGGGAHTTYYGVRSGGITLTGGSTMVNSYAFYADAVTGATTNYAFYSNGGLVHFGDNVDLTSGKTLTMPVGSIITDTTTGLKIGTATTQKIGFFNVTPVVQPSAYTQTYATAAKTVPAATAATLTDSTGGTADTTLAAVEAAYTQATVRNNFADLAAMVNKLTADDLAIKKVINSLVDDLQALGIIS